MKGFQLVFIILFSAFSSFGQKFEVFYSSAVHELSSTQKEAIDSVLLSMKSPFYKVQVTGHTDSIGNMAYNLDLSLKRATGVKQYILSRRPGFEIDILGVAYKMPKTANSSESGRASNRRVEMKFDVKEHKKEVWTLRVQSFDFKNNQTAVLKTEGGCSLKIKPGSFATKPEAEVNVKITEYNDPVDFLAGGLPMSYTTAQREHMFESEEMLKIEAMSSGQPVMMTSLMELECPQVDTTRGLKFYEFKESDQSWFEIEEEIVEKEGEISEFDQEKILAKDKEEDFGEDEIEELILPPEPKKEAKKELKKALKKKLSNISIRQEKPEPIETEIEIEPDTGSVMIVDEFSTESKLYYDLIRHLIKRRRAGGDMFFRMYANDCFGLSCVKGELEYTLGQVEESLLSTPELPENFDLRTHWGRYTSMAYDGLERKCFKETNELYQVKIDAKKRFLRRQLVLTLEVPALFSEYNAFAEQRWYFKYGKDPQAAADLLAYRISNFRVLEEDDLSKKKPKSLFFLELKTEQQFAYVPVRPKKVKYAVGRHRNYQVLLHDRIKAFEDSVIKQVYSIAFSDWYCQYSILQSFIWASRPKCVGVGPRCLGDISPDLPLLSESWEHELKKKTGEQCFRRYGEWIRDEDMFPAVMTYLYAHKEEAQAVVNLLKENLEEFRQCMCDTIECNQRYKYEHSDPSQGNSPVMYVGLGVYNFDRVFVTEDKSIVQRPLFVTSAGDTIARPNIYMNKGMKRESWGHQAYTVVPGFNGLLRHSFLPQISLLSGKKNVILINYGKNRYMGIVDLSKKEWKERPILVKDITEESKSLQGLKDLLENPEKAFE